MRHTLEELKAMDDFQLRTLWNTGAFPFETMRCGKCLTEHLTYLNARGRECEHSHVVAQVARLMSLPLFVCPNDADLRNNVEELYALRLFYDHLYPQTVEPQEPEPPSACGATPDLGVEAVVLPLIDDEAEWDSRAGTRESL